ncbi:MAG: glycosyltransferase family A protein, partial [Litorilinea sp.]
TIGVPLYHSARFVEIIIRNLEAIDYPNLEYIISDRHCADGALATLANHFADDARVRFVAATDGLNWVEHYNLLLEAATGDYMMWMPHDDSYAADYVATLVRELEDNPDCILAFGTLNPIDMDDNPAPIWLANSHWHTCIDAAHPWTVREPLRLYIKWNLGIAMRGIFRCASIKQHHLTIQPTPQSEMADICWIFGVGLRGALRNVPAAQCYKRYHAHNTHTQWQGGTRRQEVRKRWGRLVVLLGYAVRHVPRPTDLIRVILVLLLRNLTGLPGRYRLIDRLIAPPRKSAGHFGHRNS